MPTIETKDGIFLDIPEGMAPDAPEVKAAVAQERAGRFRRKMDSPEMKAKIAAQQERDRAEYDPTKDMSLWDRSWANVGAGTMNLAQGGQQLLSKVGLAKPVSDEDVREKRRLDDQLASSVQTGMGADWMPRMGKVLQFAGEVAPTLAIPGGVFAQAGRVALPAALTATAGRAAITSGALQGGLYGALQPVTSDESRAMNTGVGALAGAALPAAVQGWKALRGSFSDRGAREAAGKMLGVNEKTPLPADPATLATRGAENVPLSTAATYGDEALAAKELASRASGRATEGWSELGRQQRGAVWENVQQGTQRAGTETAERAARKTGWDKDVAAAMKNANPKAWQQEMAQLRQNLEVALRSPEGQNQMRPVLNEIIRQMDDLGAEFSPQHLAQLRSRMAGSVRGSPMDPFTSAPVSDPAYASLRTEFDNILNAVTGNKWQRVLEGYKARSVPVAQAKAESLVERQFMTPEGTPRVTTAEGTPVVTEAALRRAITAPQMKNVRGTAPTFAPESERVLKGTLEALERQNVVQRAKQSATGGGGSMTAPLTEALKRMDPTSATDWLHRAAMFAKSIGHSHALRELDQALIDPQRYYQIVQETLAAGKPLTPAQQMAVKAIQQTTSAAGVEAMQPQEPAYATR